MTPFGARLVAVSALVVFCGAAPGLATRSADPPLSPDQIGQFLLTAKIVKHKDLGKGITRPIRLTLTDGTLTHDAVFSSVQETQSVMKYASGQTELDFVDSYAYNIAAYRLAGLLGSRAGGRGAVALARAPEVQGGVTWRSRPASGGWGWA